jgi:hypothetical protein
MVRHADQRNVSANNWHTLNPDASSLFKCGYCSVGGRGVDSKQLSKVSIVSPDFFPQKSQSHTTLLLHALGALLRGHEVSFSAHIITSR